MKIQYQIPFLTRHPSKSYGKRPLSKISRIVVHHFAGNISVHQAAEMHVKQKQWPGIGYFAVIDFDGTINVCNNLDTVSYNVSNGNTPTLGIALRGNYQEKEPPVTQWNALVRFIEILHGILGPLPVHCHSDFVNTKCPGEVLRKKIRQTYGSYGAMTVRKPWYLRLKSYLFDDDQGDPDV